MRTDRDRPVLRRCSRRSFIEGTALCGVAALAPWAAPAAAGAQSGVQPEVQRNAHARGLAEALRGSAFDLTIDRTPVTVTRSPETALTINGSLPAPPLRWRQGDTVTIRVDNRLDEDASIHWHGIVLPANMDGVPGLSFHGIPARGRFTYRFPVRQAGTYWYHSHSGFQEQRGLYGPLIIDPIAPEPFAYDREHIVMLTDWTDENSARVFGRLKKQSNYYNRQQRTVADFFRDVREHGLGGALADRRMWGEMRMNPTDLADVSGATYTYLLNGLTAAENWTGLFTAGERVRLRVINGSAMSYFDVRIPGLKMTVVAADGQSVHPVAVDEFRIATAETFDVIVEPSGAEAFTIFAQSNDRSGFAAGTLAVRHGLRAPVPALDPRPLLTMADLGHGEHGEHGQPSDSGGGEHTGHGAPAGAHANHDPSAGAPPGAVPAGQPDAHAGHGTPPSPASGALVRPSGGQQQHPPSEHGNPLVDMQVTAPVARLNDPGVGLRDNGRRVLTYADLRSLFADPDGREPGRTIELHLTGHMERFAWSFDGIKFSDAAPLRLKYGERLRVVLVNDTMMSHPIHLHGMWSDLEDDDGRFLVRKHTIDMPPGTRRSYRVTADALGRWAYHCHLLFHMEAGMFREVRVEE